MSKGLEALAELYSYIKPSFDYQTARAVENYKTIEKELKVFDIMLENNVDLSILRRSRTCEEYNRQSYRRLSQEHFDFLKEQIR